MPKRWIWILLPLIAAGAVFWWLFIRPEPEPGPARLTVLETQREIANLPHYIAAGRGYFREAGLEVTLGTAPRGELTAEDTGRVDLVLTSFDRILEGGWTAVAGLTHAEPALLLAREEKLPFAWAELAGKTIVGESPAGTGELALERILRGHELIPQSQYVTIQHLPPHLRLGTYLAGTGQYIILTDPEATRMEKSGLGYIASDLTGAGNIPARIAAAPTDTLEENKEALHRYVQAVARAQAWLTAQSPEEITAAASPWFPWLSYEATAATITRARKTDLWPEGPRIEQSHYDHLLELLIEAGELPARIPYKRMVVEE